MICDEFSPAPESAQAEATGFGAEGEAMMRRARAFVEGNPDTWAYMVANAARLASSNGYFSVKYLIEMARNERFARIRNADSPAYSRILREQRPDLAGAMRTHRSKCDGLLEVA